MYSKLPMMGVRGELGGGERATPFASVQVKFVEDGGCGESSSVVSSRMSVATELSLASGDAGGE